MLPLCCTPIERYEIKVKGEEIRCPAQPDILRFRLYLLSFIS
ncbi:hypothetical protein HMPREF1546_02152 [Oscillibacter sp. KLE 1745]|nr:hypothetical protein HMPREF1546_02152 [Oscillibacter sp. KLE 1745]